MKFIVRGAESKKERSYSRAFRDCDVSKRVCCVSSNERFNHVEYGQVLLMEQANKVSLLYEQLFVWSNFPHGKTKENYEIK